MNFDQLNITPDKIKLPPEFIGLAKKGILDASKAQDSLTKVSEAMVVRGISDDEREAYLKILQALSELKRHQAVLSEYTSS